MKLAYSSITRSKIFILFFAKFMFLADVMIILVSYMLLIRAMLRMQSAGGQAKTFSTCTSCLPTIVLFSGTLAFMCCRSNSKKTIEEDKIMSVFYTVLIPLQNPLAYSLRNKAVKATFKKVIGKIQSPRDAALDEGPSS